MASPFSIISQQIKGKAKDIEMVGTGFLCPRIIMFDKIKRPRQIHNPSSSSKNKKINKLLTIKPSFIVFALNFHVVSILSLAIKRTEMSKLNPYM